jgi:hypothetical protein
MALSELGSFFILCLNYTIGIESAPLNSRLAGKEAKPTERFRILNGPSRMSGDSSTFDFRKKHTPAS